MSDVVGYRVAMQEERAGALRDRVQQLLAPFSGTERALDSGCGAGTGEHWASELQGRHERKPTVLNICGGYFVSEFQVLGDARVISTIAPLLAIER